MRKSCSLFRGSAWLQTWNTGTCWGFTQNYLLPIFHLLNHSCSHEELPYRDTGHPVQRIHAKKKLKSNKKCVCLHFLKVLYYRLVFHERCTKGDCTYWDLSSLPVMNRLVSSGIFLLCSNYIGWRKERGKEKHDMKTLWMFS